jgi:hypothetical protein
MMDEMMMRGGEVGERNQTTTNMRRTDLMSIN